VSETPAIDQRIIDQLEKVRQDGRCNMLDSRCVQAVANKLNLYALVVWIEDNRKKPGLYMQALEEMGQQRSVTP